MKKPDATDKFLEVVSVVFLLSTVLIVSIAVPNLPDTVPVHFDMNGEPNRYGSKYFLWTSVAVSVFIYMLLGVIAMFPESFNYPSKKSDTEGQYKLGVKLIRSLKACILLFVAILSYAMVRSAQTSSAKDMFWLMPIVPAFLVGNLIWFAVKWKKLK